MTCDSLIGGWSFEIMLDRETLFSILNCLDVWGLKLPVIVTGRKPSCWQCGEFSHLSSPCPETKASGSQASGSQAPVDQNPFLLTFSTSASLVMVMPTSGTVVVKPLVRYGSEFTFSEMPFPTACAIKEKENGEWQVASMARGNRQTAGPCSEKFRS